MNHMVPQAGSLFLPYGGYFSYSLREHQRYSRSSGPVQTTRSQTLSLPQAGTTPKGIDGALHAPGAILQCETWHAPSFRFLPAVLSNLKQEGATMGISLTIYNETLLGSKDPALTLDFLKESISVRELIRERIYEEVRLYKVTNSDGFQGLVQPSEQEETLNGPRTQAQRQIDWEKQYSLALEAFQRNGFFILVDDRQIESLEEITALTPTTQVSFVKLATPMSMA
jgi:hypothetical protein